MATISSKILVYFCIFLVVILWCFDGGVYGVNLSCSGSMAECDEDLENLMDSEINRRFLETKKYISPGVLKRDQPVCKTNGQAYTGNNGCLPSKSNDYDRGCSKIYRCRGGS